MLVVTVRLTPDDGEALMTAVDASADAWAADASPEERAATPRRARRADALMRLVRGETPRTEVVLHVGVSHCIPTPPGAWPATRRPSR